MNTISSIMILIPCYCRICIIVEDCVFPMISCSFTTNSIPYVNDFDVAIVKLYSLFNLQ